GNHAVLVARVGGEVLVDVGRDIRHGRADPAPVTVHLVGDVLTDAVPRERHFVGAVRCGIHMQLGDPGGGGGRSGGTQDAIAYRDNRIGVLGAGCQFAVNNRDRTTVAPGLFNVEGF